MLIFGTRGIPSANEAGKFFCPICASEHDYRRMVVRRFFTLYFVPLIPLGTEGSYIECKKCHGTFADEVLNPDTSEFPQNSFLKETLLRLMTMMMLADKVVRAEEIRAISELYNTFFDDEISEDDIRATSMDPKNHYENIDRFLSHQRSFLNDVGKEVTIRALLLIAMSDGELLENELAFAKRVSEALGMTRIHYQGVISDVFSEETKH